MTKSLQKTGGIAALYLAAAYLVGIVYFLLVVNYPSVVDPLQKVALIADNQLSMYILHLLIYVVFGIVLVVLALALHERLRAGAPATMQTATALGLIWAGVLIASGMVFNVGIAPVVELYGKDPTLAALVWLAIDTVSQGLSGNGEILGGLWTLLASWAALRAGGLPRALNYLGVVIGVAGILSVVPVLKDLAIVFGVSQIIWFVWLGISMLGRSPSAVAQQEVRFAHPTPQP